MRRCVAHINRRRIKRLLLVVWVDADFGRAIAEAHAKVVQHIGEVDGPDGGALGGQEAAQSVECALVFRAADGAQHHLCAGEAAVPVVRLATRRERREAEG